MANYSYEKGKYGSTAGTIVPFPRRLDGKQGTDWVQYVPAGYLRCDGSKLSADLYPNLARILGTGDASIYKKENVELDDDEFQLPDLGSKYIKASPSSGGYESYYAVGAPSGVLQPKVGVDVELESTEGTGQITVAIQYTGSFSIPARSVVLNGNLAISIPGSTDQSTVTSDSMLPHGHWSNTVSLRGSTVSDNYSYDTTQTFGSECTHKAESVETQIGDDLSEEATLHSHTVKYGSPPTKSISGNITALTASVEDKLFTDVKINIDDTYVINDVQPPFILVEYLIKY
jgi:hypothetical protein